LGRCFTSIACPERRQLATFGGQCVMRAGDAESKHNDDSGGQYPAHDYERADDLL
jgi:hypothetical protein